MSDTAANIDYKQLYESSLLMNQQLLKSLQQQQEQVTQLQYQLQQLTKLLKGFKSERFIPTAISNLQPELGFAAMESVPQATYLSAVKKISYTKVKRSNNEANGVNGAQLPDHLRRETTILEPTEDVKDCIKIGEEVRETLGWKPGEIYVNRMIVNVYSRPAAKSGKSVIIKASLPPRAINKCLADPALLAQVVVDKFVDHKPLNRQIEALKRNGVAIAYSTMSDWVGSVANIMAPLGTIHLREMYRYEYWQADETGIAVLDSAKKKETHKGYYWTYLTGDGRLIYYDYQPGRGGERALNVLKDFKGHLQVDGYAVYDQLPLNDVTVFYCMAHARRKIFDAQSNNQELATYALAEIAKLYAIEEECRQQQLSKEQIKSRRQKDSLPILTSLGSWMRKEYEKLRPKTPIAKAFAYSIKRWNKLSLYADSGDLQIDNNNIERCMRNVAVGRKNYLFCGSHDAATRAGLLYSLLVTCKLNDVNPYEWLKDVLSHNINEMPISQIKSLLPQNWTKPDTNQ